MRCTLNFSMRGNGVGLDAVADFRVPYKAPEL